MSAQISDPAWREEGGLQRRMEKQKKGKCFIPYMKTRACFFSSPMSHHAQIEVRVKLVV